MEALTHSLPPNLPCSVSVLPNDSTMFATAFFFLRGGQSDYNMAGVSVQPVMLLGMRISVCVCVCVCVCVNACVRECVCVY